MKKWVVMAMVVAMVALMVFATGASAGIFNFGKGSACSPIAGGSCQGHKAKVTQTGVNGVGNNNVANQFSGRDSNNIVRQYCRECIG